MLTKEIDHLPFKLGPDWGFYGIGILSNAQFLYGFYSISFDEALSCSR